MAKPAESEKISLITSPWKNILLNTLKRTKNSFTIVTPTLKLEVLKWIRGVLLSKNLKKPFYLKIMCRLNEYDIATGETDIEVCEYLRNLAKDDNIELEHRYVPNLNANYYIFDDREVILISSRLNPQHLLSNIECGVILEGSGLIEELFDDFKIYWNAAHKFSEIDVEDFLDQVRERNRKIGSGNGGARTE